MDSCCPNGEVCDWDPTEDTCDFTELPCGDNCVPCGDYCMPITGTCCSSEGTYCPDFGTCMSGDTCCYLGDNCESSNINSTATPTSKSLLTPSVTSSAGQGSPPASTPAGFGITLPTSNSHGASKTTQPSITVTRTATVTATATPSTIPLSAGQACSYCRVTGLAITGFAVAFSLLA
ncbi:hypothetical protein RRF57_001838 [Xylaria bambusicola]|uniref:Uncharacterized protein n=1 Tax=Xylaria bambusicola TaxID=326684 RepID=A0AAN7Z3Y1_9PEZI